MDKYSKYILIAILIGVVAILYFVYKNQQDTQDQTDMLIDNERDTKRQSDLLVVMAQKLGATLPDPPVKEKEEPKLSEQDQNKILVIADKLCFNKELDAEEQKFYKKYSAQINQEQENSEKILSIIVDKFLNGSKSQDFNSYEKEFYESYPQEVDEIVRYEMELASIVKKITSGSTDFSAEELQFQQNNAKEIEAELAAIAAKEVVSSAKILKVVPPLNPDLSKAAPPLTDDSRLKVILSAFEDGMPKMVGEIPVTNKAMHKTIGRIEEKGQLLSYKFYVPEKKRDMIFYGLPQWFDGKKLKPEFVEKIKLKHGKKQK